MTITHTYDNGEGRIIRNEYLGCDNCLGRGCIDCQVQPDASTPTQTPGEEQVARLGRIDANTSGTMRTNRALWSKHYQQVYLEAFHAEANAKEDEDRQNDLGYAEDNEDPTC